MICTKSRCKETTRFRSLRLQVRVLKVARRSAVLPSVLPAGQPGEAHEADHLSTREIMFDTSSHQVYMVIQQRRVSMRTDDFHLNISQILLVAAVGDYRKRQVTKELKERNIISADGRHYWAPFRHGVFVCQFANFESELMPLLTYAPLPLPERNENYLLTLVMRKRTSQRPSYPAKLRFRRYAEGDNGEHGGRLDRMDPRGDFAYHNGRPKEGGPTDHLVRAQPPFDDSRTQQQSMPANSLHKPSIPTHKGEPIRSTEDTNLPAHPGASGLSFDADGLVYMDIRGRRVSEESKEVARSPGIYPERAAGYRSEAHGASGSSCDLVDYDLGNDASTMITTYDPAHCDPDTSLLDNSVSVGSWFQLTAQDGGEEPAAFDLDGVRDSSFEVSNAHQGDAAGACSDASHTPVLVTPWEDNAGSYRYSQVTERSYADGSYLAPADHSFKQLLE